MSRSLKKGPYRDLKLSKKIEKYKNGEITGAIKTWSRASQIFPDMVNMTFKVHTGKEFHDVKITEDMIGFRLGEFAPTRKFRRHGGKLQKEQESKQNQKTVVPAEKTK
ncbi:MAG: small subunit ribosomal protein S19 [Candidatus Berkelbacteria bacterium Licking1014_85]|uniref:Small ribosomal subunit protein uS19 n=1 Tax=Candidatus Berkelbacteria bacterium Licking1014_85 TaxID=2017148 RepID=A0A554LMS0_9BACT|nr:MAG: small subunit ribosomal protein S19 [Candidatus Berkelbacteria bacterium Licking1014_85]